MSVKAARQAKILESCRAGVADTVRWLQVLLRRHSRGLPVEALGGAGLEEVGEGRWLWLLEEEEEEVVGQERLFVAGGGGRLCLPQGFVLLKQV